VEGKSPAALMLIDFQRDFLRPDGRMPVAAGHVAPVLAAAARGVAFARDRAIPVVAIGNEFEPGDWLGNLFRRRASIRGSPGALWDERLPLDGARYLPKARSDAFSNPRLEVTLRSLGVKRIVVAGLFAQACVSATVRSALARGFEVSLLAEAIAGSSDASRERAIGRLVKRGARRCLDLATAVV
jgi:nicotinamidase-related amidase